MEERRKNPKNQEEKSHHMILIMRLMDALLKIDLGWIARTLASELATVRSRKSLRLNRKKFLKFLRDPCLKCLSIVRNLHHHLVTTASSLKHHIYVYFVARDL